MLSFASACAHDIYRERADEVKEHVKSFYGHLEAKRVDAAIRENQQIERIADDIGGRVLKQAGRTAPNVIDRHWPLFKTVSEAAAENWVSLARYFVMNKQCARARAAYERILARYSFASFRAFTNRAKSGIRELDSLSADCRKLGERDAWPLSVLSINLLFSEIDTRDQRLEAIANFAAQPSANPERSVDVILLQEVVGGALVDTANSARDLQDKLRAKGLNYHLRTAFATGLPGLLTVGNAILSRHEVEFHMVKRLPRASEIEFRGQVITLSRNVLMTRLNIPGFGKLNVYNTHLCAGCMMPEQEEQLRVLLKFIHEAEGFFAHNTPVILGGDFNIDRLRKDQPQGSLYDAIITPSFTDAYAEGQASRGLLLLEELCPSVERPDKHCTVGVSELDSGGSARRIDYIFVKEARGVSESRVVFNTLVDGSQPTVSDHAGVFASIELR